MSALDELHDVITRKDAAAATRALDADPGLATARTASGQTPALVAIYGRAPQILALLRSRGARLDVFEAAAAGDVDRVRALLDTDPSLRDAHARDGWTPLHLAGHFRQTATIELLLARDHRQSSAYTALHEAAAIGNADVVRLLLDSGAQPDARTTEGQTPADLAREAGHAALADGLEAAARGRTP